MAFMSVSHFHINNKKNSCPFLSLSYAINFILTFLPKKNTAYEINLSNHHNISTSILFMPTEHE
jgi:hypothetical protein